MRADGLVEIDLSFADQLQESQFGPGFGHRAALVDRVRRRGFARFNVLDAGRELGSPPVAEDTDHRTRNSVLRQEFGEPCVVEGHRGRPTAFAASASKYSVVA